MMHKPTALRVPSLKRSGPDGIRGLTLLEVLVAMVLLTLAIGTLMSGLGGVSKLSGAASQHDFAVRLAQAKMDEYLRQDGDALSPEPDDLIYAGVKYGVRLSSRMHNPNLAPMQQSTQRLPTALQRVEVEVFWGGKPDLHRFSLVTYHRRKVAA